MCKWQISRVHIMGFRTDGDDMKHNRDMVAGWWFQPSWKIWKSMGRIIPNIMAKKMFETTNQQKSVFACFWSGVPKVIVLGFTLLSSLNPVDLGHDGLLGYNPCG